MNTILSLISAFALLWIGANTAVKTVNLLSHRLHTSSFFISFFVLGFFTSITEIFLGINAAIEKQPEIFLGNLLGSTVVVYLVVIPLLAVAGNGVRLTHTLKFKEVITAIVVGGFPALLTIDNKFTLLDAAICTILYVYFVSVLNSKSSLMDKIFHKELTAKIIWTSVARLLVGVIFVFLGSHILVEQTPLLGQQLGISPFIVSLLLLSLGTNIPEITIALASIFSKQKGVALGSYVGSASLNTFELGILTLLGKRSIVAEGSNYSVITYILGLIFLLFFLKSKSEINRREGLVLFSIYIVFVICELITGPGWTF